MLCSGQHIPANIHGNNHPLSNSNHHWPVALRFTALWLIFITWCSCVGWILSAFSMLNSTGYLLALPLLLGAWFAFWKTSASDSSPFRFPTAIWKRPSTIAWTIAIIACLWGGIAYAPANYDALSYRLPRLLYWWQENRWHWLEHGDDRMNYSGVGFEWQMLPFFVLQKSDRFLFLLNWIPFLFFPALCFRTLLAFGVSKKSSSFWMWVIPFGFGFTLQASSIGNDAIGAILLLASITFASYAENQHTRLALILSALAASALTSVKLSNLPLLLPIAWFWLRAAWVMRHKLIAWQLAPGLMAAALGSFIPLAVLSHIHCGSWGGDPDDDFKLRITKTIPGIAGNAYFTAIGMLEPPIMPIAKSSLKKITAPLEGDDSFASWVRTGFPRFRAGTFGEIPTEEGAGLGLGITAMLLIHFFKRKPHAPRNKIPWLPIAATIIAMAAYMAKMGSESTARLTLPYAPLLIASFLVIFQRRESTTPLTRNMLALIPLVLVLPSLILNPNRPIIPLSYLSAFPGISESNRKRITDLTAAYGSRNDTLAGLRDHLPPEAREIGFAGGPTQSAYSLFKPFGSKRIIESHPGNIDSFDWLIACPSGILERTGKNWDEWLASSPYHVVASQPVVFTVLHGSETWYVLRSRMTNN